MAKTDYFADNVDSGSTYGAHISPSAVMHHGTQRRVYASWQYKDASSAEDRDPHMNYWDDILGEWGTEKWIGFNPLSDITPDDSHGSPAHIVDNDGYIHITWGTHGGTQSEPEYYVSTNVEDISAWTSMGNDVLGGSEEFTYPKLLKIKDGTLYLFFRGTNGDIHYQKTTAVNGTSTTWDAASTEIINITETSDLVYLGNVAYDSLNNRIHFVWMLYDYSDSEKRKNIYHAYWNLTDGKFYQMDGTELTTSTSVKQDVDFADCLIVNSGSYETGYYGPCVRLDASGNPYILYEIETDTDTASLKHIHWTGSAWSSQYTICDAYWDTVGGFSDGDIIPVSNSSATCYVTNDTFQLVKYTFNGSAWSLDSTINTSSCRHPMLVENWIDSCRLIFIDATNGYLYALNSSDEYVGMVETYSDMRVIVQDTSAQGIFEDDLLVLSRNVALEMFSLRRPKECTATLDTVADSYLVDISSLSSNLLWGYDNLSFHSVYGLEYETGKDPRQYRNFTVHSDGNIEMDLSSEPSASSEDVNVRYYDIHTMSSVPLAYQYIISRLATAIAAQSKFLYYLNEWMAVTDKFTNVTTAISNMTSRIGQLVTDLAAGRLLIAEQKDWVLDILEDMSDKIVDGFDAIATAEGYYNKANVGMPQIEYLHSANTSFSAAQQLLSQAKGYLSTEGFDASYRQNAIAQVNGANGYLNQATGYMNYLKARNGTLAMVQNYEAWGLRLKQELMGELNACAIRRSYKRWPRS